MAGPTLGHEHGLVGGSLVTQTLIFFPLYAYAHKLGTEWIVNFGLIALAGKYQL